jgi:hypothetical protein
MATPSEETNMVRIINGCEVKQITGASGRSSPAVYIVTSRRNGATLGTITRYRGTGSPWQASNPAGQLVGTFYPDALARQMPGVTGGGERAAVASLVH